VLRPSACDPPAEMAASDTEEGNVLDEAEDNDVAPQSAASPPANATTDHAPAPVAGHHDGNSDSAEGVSAAHIAPASTAAASNGVAHAADAASPRARSRPQQQSSDSDDDDDLPLNARLLRESPSSDAAAAQVIAGRRRQPGREGSPDERLEALGSVDSAAGMADAVISTVTGTSSVAAAAGAPVSCGRGSCRAVHSLVEKRLRLLLKAITLNSSALGHVL